MRFPKMTGQRRTTVTVPQLSGGVNRWDRPEHVGDNQLTACNNLWWHNGALQTRPGVQTLQESGYSRIQPISDREVLLYHITRKSDTAFTFWAQVVTPDGITEQIGSEDNTATIQFTVTDPILEDAYVEETEFTLFALRGTKKSGYDWHFFWSAGGFSVMSWSHKEKAWDDPLPYEPLVMMNGKGNRATADSNAVTVEAVNMLSPRYRCTYITDGVSDRYPLPLPGVDNFGYGLNNATVNLSLYNEKAAAFVTVSSYISSGMAGGYFGYSDNPALWGVDATKYQTVRVRPVYHDDGGAVKPYLTFEAMGTPVGGNAESRIKGYVLPSAYGTLDNNLEIHMPLQLDKLDTIERMQRAVWFGGDRSDGEGGVHLFVAGHPDKPNLLHWSDVNNPLYFPENNYVCVGEDSAPITALAKQGELLVIFREHDMYCAQYVAGDMPTAQELESGTAIETTVHKAYFPITQLHPNIGCDCPGTIRLVNNRLLWLTSDGRVHILTATNPYSERNVRQVSPLIEQELKTHSKEALRAAVAGEYEGYYTLLVGNRMYLLDCQTSAFHSFQYYSREETAQKALPWYIWTLPQERYTAAVNDGNGMVLVGEHALFALQGDTDDGVAIRSGFTTKLFRFGREDVKKSIDQVYLSVGDVAGCRMTVGYVTEQGTVEDACVLACDGTHNGALRSYRLTPHIRMAASFGLTLSAENPMTVAGVLINYKNQGVVR